MEIVKFDYENYFKQIKQQKDFIIKCKYNFLLSNKKKEDLMEYNIKHNSNEYGIKIMEKIFKESGYYNINDIFILACEYYNLEICKYIFHNYELDLLNIQKKIKESFSINLKYLDEYFFLKKNEQIMQLYKFLFMENFLPNDENFVILLICKSIKVVCELKNLAFWLIDFHKIDLNNMDPLLKVKFAKSILINGNEEFMNLVNENFGVEYLKKIFNINFLMKNIYRRKSIVTKWIIENLLCYNLLNIDVNDIDSQLNCCINYNSPTELFEKLKLIMEISRNSYIDIKNMALKEIFVNIEIENSEDYLIILEYFNTSKYDILNIINTLEYINLIPLIFIIDKKFGLNMDEFYVIFKKLLNNSNDNILKKIFGLIFINFNKIIRFKSYLFHQEKEYMNLKLKRIFDYNHDPEYLKFIFELFSYDEKLVIELFELSIKNKNYDNFYFLAKKFSSLFKHNEKKFFALLDKFSSQNTRKSNTLLFYKFFKIYENPNFLDYIDKLILISIQEELIDNIIEIMEKSQKSFEFNDTLFSLACQNQSNQIALFIYNNSKNKELLTNEALNNVHLDNNIPLQKFFTEIFENKI